MIIESRLSIPTLLSLLLLAGCSAHPGSGIWLPAEGSESPFSRVEVLFEGRAELFTPGREEHLYRCFWGGIAADTVRMECVSADDETDKRIFTLRASEEGTARLSEDGRDLGLFRRSEEIPTRKE